MALANFTDLKASIADWLHRSDLTTVTPDFVTLAEARIARDLRLRGTVLTTTLSTTAGTQTLAAPSDFLETENITLMTSVPRNMTYITPEQMDARFPSGYYPGEPSYYSMVGTNFVLGPTPDAVYSISLDYYPRLNLASSATNWLMTNHPNIYLFAALHEGAIYARDAELASMALQKYQAEADLLNSMDDAGLRSGSAIRVRAL